MKSNYLMFPVIKELSAKTLIKARNKRNKFIKDLKNQKFRAKDHSFDEFILILEGKLTLTEDTGEVHNFIKGDLLVYPKGFSGTWENSDNYKEFIIIQTGALDDFPSMEGMD